MDEKPMVLGLGPTGRGYLYVGDALIGPAEDGRLTARPADPQPSGEPGFVELSVSLHQRQVDRLSDLDSSISEPTQWRFKLAGTAPWNFPEYVIELGCAGGRASMAEQLPETQQPHTAGQPPPNQGWRGR